MLLTSVGLPVFNGERYLESAIASILGQDLSEFELILSDNASTDGTSEICRQAAHSDSRVRHVRQPENCGATHNFNAVFREARGRYFAWAAHDDSWHPSFLRTCVEMLEDQATAAVCHARAQPIDTEGVSFGEPSVGKVIDDASAVARFWRVVHDPTMHAAVYGVIRRAELEKTRLFLPKLQCDHVLIAELAVRGQVIETSEVLHRKRMPRPATPYRTPDEMFEYLGGTGRRPPSLQRLRTIVECVRGARRVGDPGQVPLFVAAGLDAYVRGGAGLVDLKELALGTGLGGRLRARGAR